MKYWFIIFLFCPFSSQSDVRQIPTALTLKNATLETVVIHVQWVDHVHLQLSVYQSVTVRCVHVHLVTLVNPLSPVKQ